MVTVAKQSSSWAQAMPVTASPGGRLCDAADTDAPIRPTVVGDTATATAVVVGAETFVVVGAGRTELAVVVVRPEETAPFRAAELQTGPAGHHQADAGHRERHAPRCAHVSCSTRTASGGCPER